jgi:hypothetical protein
MTPPHFNCHLSHPDTLSFFFFFFFAVLGFELRAYALSYSSSPLFVKSFFKINSLYFPGWLKGWLKTTVCLISAF